ncbi:MAG: tRNA pseudouridine(38-40) synthase TruA [Planctomycetaceae bacterium]|nr:tRNA pseudouridine(38-40) synthase TruA [Planctomycetaceae bacterium]
MPRFRLTLAYDGTAFHGWQRQEPQGAPPLRTVQGVVEEAVFDLIRQRVDVVGASRTDSGVHAVGQVAAFTADVRVPVERLAAALNSRLPDDVRVLDAERTFDGFNPIGGARSKCYRYTIEHTSHPHNPRPLFDSNLVFATPYVLDAERMQHAAAQFVGTYDCASFAQVNHGRTTTVRTVFDCCVREPAPRRVEIEIAASGFLYNMVRIVAGTLLEVGRGRIAPEEIRAIAAACDRTKAGPTLPPQGLCLRWIWYGAPRGDSQQAESDAGASGGPVEGAALEDSE